MHVRGADEVHVVFLAYMGLLLHRALSFNH